VPKADLEGDEHVVHDEPGTGGDEYGDDIRFRQPVAESQRRWADAAEDGVGSDQRQSHPRGGQRGARQTQALAKLGRHDGDRLDDDGGARSPQQHDGESEA
jgi:hypothetical protein